MLDYSPKWLWKQFTEKYGFEKVSWNYLEFAIPRFLSKHLGEIGL